jgi:ElaB/YqjD/DUF883 family membrane-anchored ribosome-binding protein
LNAVGVVNCGWFDSALPFLIGISVQEDARMRRQSGYSRGIAASVEEIERHLRSIERGLERSGTRASAGASHAADGVAETVASALAALSERFRGSGLGDEAARFGNGASKFGKQALRRLSSEAEHRPLVTLAVAAGVGLLVGIIARSR